MVDNLSMIVTHYETVGEYAVAVQQALTDDVQVHATMLLDNDGVSSLHVLAVPGTDIMTVHSHITRAVARGVYSTLPADEFLFRLSAFTLRAAMFVVGASGLEQRLLVPNEGAGRSV